MSEDKIKIILNFLTIGNYKRAITEAVKLSNKNPDNSGLKNLLGLAYLGNKEINQAIKNFKFALKIDQNNIAANNNLGNSYKYLHNYKDAEHFYKRALNLNPNFINTLNDYANLKSRINKSEEAIILYKKALAINDKNHISSFNLALTYQSIGDFEQAKQYAEKALLIEPNFTIADHLLAANTKYTKENNHFLKMKSKILNKKIGKQQKIYLHFALAKAFKEIGDFNDSIYHLENGNALKNSLVKYNIDSDIKLFNLIKNTFTNIDFDTIELKDNSSKLIFVVGMPRSGTSLVEQILSSHDKVFGAGELSFLEEIISSKINGYPDNLKFLLRDLPGLNSIAQSYLEKIMIIKNDNKITLDKSLLNFLWIGFIRIIFPKAKIIHVKRDPRDTCLSCYKTLFDNGLHFTYSKSDLPKYYNQYSDLMNFWKQLLGDYIYTINYEDLIKDPNKNISNLLDFCELNFDKKCLDFHKNTSPVKTMSASQVRQKIYSSSIKSYEKYEEKIPDLFSNLLAE